MKLKNIFLTAMIFFIHTTSFCSISQETEDLKSLELTKASLKEVIATIETIKSCPEYLQDPQVLSTYEKYKNLYEQIIDTWQSPNQQVKIGLKNQMLSMVYELFLTKKRVCVIKNLKAENDRIQAKSTTKNLLSFVLNEIEDNIPLDEFLVYQVQFFCPKQRPYLSVQSYQSFATKSIKILKSFIHTMQKNPRDNIEKKSLYRAARNLLSLYKELVDIESICEKQKNILLNKFSQIVPLDIEIEAIEELLNNLNEDNVEESAIIKQQIHEKITAQLIKSINNIADQKKAAVQEDDRRYLTSKMKYMEFIYNNYKEPSKKTAEKSMDYIIKTLNDAQKSNTEINSITSDFFKYLLEINQRMLNSDEIDSSLIQIEMLLSDMINMKNYILHVARHQLIDQKIADNLITIYGLK